MASLWPGGACEPCETGRHLRCLGWTGPGICGCSRGACLIRLLTARVRDRDHPEQSPGDD